MFKIGVVDLDTSHPVAWVPKINAYGDMRVIAIWDSGAVNPRNYVEEFAEKNQVDTIAESVEAMVPLVDAVIIHGVDWDVHVDKAAPFIEAGKPVLIDKPMVGKLQDVDRLIGLQKEHPDVPIMGGSSVRFSQEIAALKAQKNELGDIVFAFASGPGDFFSYGIHTIEMFQGFLGAGVKSVRFLGDKNKSEFFEAVYFDGTVVVYQMTAPTHEWFFSVSTSKGIKSTFVDATKIYDGIIEQFHEMLCSGKAPLAIGDFLEAVKIQLAARMARGTGMTVYLDELPYDEGFDGKSYTAQYRIGKWGGKY
jgi:predicted dehydrogenase